MTPCTEKSIFRSHIHVFTFGTTYTKINLVHFLTCVADYFVHHQNVISHLHKNHKVQNLVLQIN